MLGLDLDDIFMGDVGSTLLGYIVRSGLAFLNGKAESACARICAAMFSWRRSICLIQCV